LKKANTTRHCERSEAIQSALWSFPMISSKKYGYFSQFHCDSGLLRYARNDNSAFFNSLLDTIPHRIDKLPSDLIDITWREPESVWTYRKVHAVGYKSSTKQELQGPATVGIQFVKSPSITHLRERAIGLFLSAMDLRHYAKHLVLILPNENCFKTAIQMCQKAGFQNGHNNVWWWYPLDDIEIRREGLYPKMP
jgi:hypothetical protein